MRLRGDLQREEEEGQSHDRKEIKKGRRQHKQWDDFKKKEREGKVVTEREES